MIFSKPHFTIRNFWINSFICFSSSEHWNFQQKNMWILTKLNILNNPSPKFVLTFLFSNLVSSHCNVFRTSYSTPSPSYHLHHRILTETSRQLEFENNLLIYVFQATNKKKQRRLRETFQPKTPLSISVKNSHHTRVDARSNKTKDRSSNTKIP